MGKVNKLKKNYRAAVIPIITEIYRELDMNKYDDMWKNRFHIFKEARMSEKSEELMNLVNNFTDVINLYNSIFTFKGILVLDREYLLELFPETISETKELLSIFQTEKIMPEFSINQLERQIKQLNNLGERRDIEYTLYKLVLYLTFYDMRIAASAYAGFLYNQYLISRGGTTSEFLGGGDY